MKRLLTFSFALALLFYVFSGFSGCPGLDYATKNDLRQAEQRLKKEILLNRQHIIIVEKNIDTLRTDVRKLQEQVQILGENQDTIKLQLYQLQNGQIVIYQTLQTGLDNRSAKQQFLYRLARFLNLD